MSGWFDVMHTPRLVIGLAVADYFLWRSMKDQEEVEEDGV